MTLPEFDVLIYLDGTIMKQPRDRGSSNRELRRQDEKDGRVDRFLLAFDPHTTNKVQVWVQQ